MTKPTVLCDMDGVLVDLLREWLKQYHQVGGEYLTPEQITRYNWETQVANPNLFKKVLESGGLFYTAKPCDYARVGFEELRSFADVYIVTKVMAGNARAFDAKGGWLWRWVHPKFERDKVIFTAAKHMIRGDWLIEDAPENLARWLNAWPEGRGILIDQPYNREFVHPRCARVADLLEAAEVIGGAK